MSGIVDSLRHLLKYAKLTDTAIKIYSALAGLKPRTLGEIVSLTGVLHEDAERALRELMVAKLVREIPGRPTRYEALPPYSLIKRQIEDLTEGVKNFYNNLSKNLDQSIVLLKDGLNEFSNAVSKTFEATIMSIAGSLEKILTGVIVENIVKILEDVLKNLINVAKENASNRFMQLKDNIIMEFKESVEKSMNEFSGQVSSATETLTNQIRTLIYEQTKEQITQVLQQFELGLRAIDALVIKGFEKETTIPVEIQILKGLEKIKGQLGDIIKRAQNFVIVVAPTYDFIPEEIIAKLPPRVRVQIVAGFYPKHNEMVSRLKTRGPTTQLRDMRGLEMLGVVADMKEALLCALPETVADPASVMAIFTNDSSWITMIQSQLSHIFMGASRL